MLVTFRSKGAGDIQMFSEHADQLLGLMGKSLGPEQKPAGIITANEVGAALARLKEAASSARATDANRAKTVQITIAQRSFPLIEMLERAAQRNLDVTWGT